MKRAAISWKIAALSAAFLCFPDDRLRADWIRDFRGEMVYDDNVSRSNRSEDERDDLAFVGRVRLGRFGELSDNLRLTVTGDLEAQTFLQYDDFNRITLGATAALRYRLGLGARAAFLRIEASGGYAAFDQSLQSGARFRAGLTAGKRLADRFALSGSYFYEEIGGEIRVFDRSGHILGLAATFDLTERTQWSAGYEFRTGEVNSYAVPPRPDIVALANDRREVNTFGETYVAYNLDAITHSLSIGVSQALTESISANLRYEWQQTSRAHLSYVNNLLHLSIHAAF
ncbi:MAG: transporter [Verrucomicrobiota bacterium]|nr:transporter [Verrucomicrobiota bacterium]